MAEGRWQERVNELEATSLEIIKPKKQIEKNKWKQLQDIIKKPNMYINGVMFRRKMGGE